MPPEAHRLFIALPVAPKAIDTISGSMRNFKDYTERPIPLDAWHVTLLFLGDVENPQQYYSRLTKPLSQSFVPTVSVTHIGRGVARDQLWAYITPTPALLSLKQAITERVKSLRMQYAGKDHPEFIPHINVASLYPVTAKIGIPDGAAVTTYTVDTAHIYRSQQREGGVQYTIEASIPLGP